MKCESFAVSPENSDPPQLLEISPPPAAATSLLAQSSATNRSVNEFEAASTKKILALGAIAWAHSISSACSPSHPALFPGLEPAQPPVPPAKITLKVVEL